VRRTVQTPTTGNWERISFPKAVAVLADYCRAYQREVHDGHLSVFVGREPQGWHLSISHRTNEVKPRPARYPTWDEIADARYQFVPNEVTMAMLLPPREQYVNLHDTTFHLHQIPSDD
jgi:hypothetical protein